MPRDAAISNDKDNPLYGVSIRHLRFLELYAKTGNLSQSWMKAFSNPNRISSSTSAHSFMKKHPEAKRAILERHGINEKKIADALNDGFAATKLQFYQREKYETPDVFARIKTAEIADRMLNGSNTEKATIGNQLNIQINTEKGEFKISEG